MRPLFALFVRALREHTRARSTYWARALIALVILLMLWMSHSMQRWFGAPGRQFFSFLVGINYAFSTLAGLAICSGAVAEEKEEGTLGLLRMADLNPLSILLGKGTGRLGILFLFIAVQIPFSFLAITLGGVSVQQVLTAYTLLGSYLFALANIALLFSVIVPRVWSATLGTTALAAILCASPVFSMLTAEWLSQKEDSSRYDSLIQNLKSVTEWLLSVDPPFHAAKLVETSYYSLEVSRSVLVHLAIGLACFALAWRLFDRYARYDPAENSGPRRFSLRRIRSMRPPRPLANAVAWKDFHFQLGGRPWFVGRLVLYPAIVGVIALANWHYAAAPTVREVADCAAAVAWTMFYIELTVVTLCMWGPERWQLNLSSLLLTPLSLGRIQAEKFKASLIAIAPSLILFAAAVALSRGRLIRHISLWDEAIPILLFTAFTFVLCLNLSLRLRWAALPAALGILLLLYILFCFSAMLLFLTFGFASRGAILGFNPSKIMNFLVLAILSVATFFLWRNTQRQLVRLAAEG